MEKHPQLAKFGAAAYANLKGKLPNIFPRIMGPNCAKYLQEVVASGLTSDMVARFETTFAQAHGVKHCMATPGCTPALAVLAAAFEFQPGDEVIVSSVTDYGTILGLLVENYIPVFADTAPGTVNISAETIERCITDRTRAILVVHKTGLICDMDPILALAKKHHLIVYEDACQAVLGKYKGRLAGTMGLAAGYSFDSEKTMGSDMGGCIITNDDVVAERCRFMGHSRGATMKPDFGRTHTARGYAYRMPLCTAAVTLAQFEISPDAVAKRDRMVRLLSALIGKIPGIISLPIPDYVTVYSAWMFGFSIDPKAFSCDARTFAAQLVEEGIPGAGLGQYYLMPESMVYLQEKAAKKIYPYSKPPASRDYHYGPETCPTAHAFMEHFIRWCTFCEKYEESHCAMAAEIIRRVAERNRK
ncbi:MAG: aminotransferase class V-fold PLP-dependent enzyme [Verrucomicrobia bacterium]|nr:aminotransferase class V-fold PLP-dependent enzyme [Verrucomicrobiota bacterium]MBU1736347.1 aminotransferase class V-fold PLP-dependent enzyme [Verrucomicrobiota bacterium]MBU1857350.1 aminotransferase class V-fold PLP-dependent enzyme [Verrucomicrobiota bacterium]